MLGHSPIFLRARSKSRGFTLVELLILVALLGIILGLISPALTDALDQSNYIQCESQREMMRRAKSVYVVDHLGVSSDGELPGIRYLFNEPTNLIDDKERGVFRAYLPERFKAVCPRDTDVYYTYPWDLFNKSTCPYCTQNPR